MAARLTFPFVPPVGHHQTCWTDCFGNVVASVDAQLSALANASRAIVVLTRTDALRRQKRMRAQLGRFELLWPEPVFVTFDFENLSNGCPGACMDNRTVAASEPSTVAVALTHLAIANALCTRTTTLRVALVLEDDVVIQPAILFAQTARVLREVRASRGWHFVAMGCSQYGCGHGRLMTGMQPCSRLYLVSRAGLCLMAARGLPLHAPIDVAMPYIFAERSAHVFHVTRWSMRHGSYMHGVARGADF